MRHFSRDSGKARRRFDFLAPFGLFFSPQTLHSLTFQFIVADTGQQRRHMHPPWTHTSGFRSTLKIRGLRQIGRGPHACQSQSVSLETRVGNQLVLKGWGVCEVRWCGSKWIRPRRKVYHDTLKYFKLCVDCMLQQYFVLSLLFGIRVQVLPSVLPRVF